MKKLDPRTKFVIMSSISTAAMLTDRIPYLVLLLLFLSGIMAIGGVGLKKQKTQFLAGISMVAFLFLLQVFAGQIELGAVLSLRLLIVIMSAVLLLTSQLRDYLLAMVQCKVPYELAYMVILAFHFFPILREEAMDVYYSIQLRGMELQKCRITDKLKAFRMMCIPILSGALDRAKDTSIAMEARGFRAMERRSYMRKLKLRAHDIIIMVLIPVLMGLFVGCAGLDGGDDTIADQIILQAKTENSMTVSWAYKDEYMGILEYNGNEVIASCTEIEKEKYYRYEAVMENLEPGKTYTYRVGNGDAMTKKRKTTLAQTDDYTFIYIGDIQYQLMERDYEIWGGFFEEMFASNPNAAFALFAGDMVEKGPDLEEWENFFVNAEPVLSRIPMLSTIGNHETSIVPTMYKKLLAMPDDGALEEEIYSYDYGNAHIISLNSCLFLKERMEQDGYEEIIASVAKWLKNDLEQSDAPWKIAVMHHPMYPVAEDIDLYRLLRENWGDILSEGGVELVLCGHQHLYMRTEEINGITYVMANSGEKRSYYLENGLVLPDYIALYQEEGSNYVTVHLTDKKLEMNAFGENGEKIDELILLK